MLDLDLKTGANTLKTLSSPSSQSRVILLQIAEVLTPSPPHTPEKSTKGVALVFNPLVPDRALKYGFKKKKFGSTYYE